MHMCVYKEAFFVLFYGIFFKTVDEPNEKMKRIFRESCRLFYPVDPGRLYILLFRPPINQSSVFGHKVTIFYPVKS